MAPAARAASTRLRLLGPPALISSDAAVPLAVPQKAIALLALLAAQYDIPLPRARLAELLWPDVTDEEARANLRRQLHLLVRAIGADAFMLTKNSVQWNDALMPSDIAAFQRYANDAAAYERAISLWNGELAAGVHDDALTEVRERLLLRYAQILQAIAQTAREAGRPGDALSYLERLLSVDPLDEQVTRSLMDLRAASGDRNGALQEYNALSQRLRTELGVEPERETTELFQRVLYSTDGAATPNNLLALFTSLVGRETELDDIADAMLNHRIVTLVGSAGIGKTRLAMRSAVNHLERYADGVWFIDLSLAQNEAEIRSRVAQALNVSGDIPSALGDRSVLLLLDNCEHLLEAARAFAQDAVKRSATQILATSRRKLECSEEYVLTIEPLAFPPQRVSQPACEVASYPAARLFVERAVAVSPSFRLSDENAHSVADIVRRLDGLPLAIELVAARAGLLTAQGMLKRLGDLSAFSSRHASTRHSTVEASLQWSHALLSPIEQQVFARLCVFVGTFSMEAVQDLCNDVCDDVLRALSELVESSLVHTRFVGDTPRFSLLETVRIFAMERLRESDADALAQAAHAAHYAELAERTAPEFAGEQELEAFHQCDLDAGNFLTALRWAGSSVPSLALRLITSLWRYWIFRWNFEEARALLHVLLSAEAFESEPLERRAQAYQAAGMFEKERADAPAAKVFFERALEECRAGHLRDREIEILTALAVLEFNHGEPAQAGRLYETCLELQERAGDARAAAVTIANLGAVAQSLNEYERAMDIFERALEAFRATGNDRGVAYALRSLALCCEMLGRFDEGIVYGHECVAMYEALGEQARLADGLQTLANLLSKMGDQCQAIAFSARALEILSRMEHPIFTMLSLFGYALAAYRAGDHLEAARVFAKAWTLRETRHLSLQEENREYFAETTDAVKVALGERQFEIAWTHGKGLTIAEIARSAQTATKKPLAASAKAAR